MKRTRISKTFSFDAAHCIPHHRGKCKRPHGHTYRVQFVVGGVVQTEGPQAGMVADFDDISRIWKEHLEPMLDHQDLNETLADEVDYTTAEEIAGFLFEKFTASWIARQHPGRLEEVRVWETPTSSAVVSA